MRYTEGGRVGMVMCYDLLYELHDRSYLKEFMRRVTCISI